MESGYTHTQAEHMVGSTKEKWEIKQLNF
jgi:hypothetical protein